MDNTTVQQEAPDHDVSRPDATTLDTDYILSIEHVADLYHEAGHPLSQRALALLTC
ncbi:MAG: hypothetical protein ACREMY_19705 [bacterium]